jgi:hypothetical protein
MDAVASAWDADAFVELLGKLVGEAQHLQNGAASAPTEDRGAQLQRGSRPLAAAAAWHGRRTLADSPPRRGARRTLVTLLRR